MTWGEVLFISKIPQLLSRLLRHHLLGLDEAAGEEQRDLGVVHRDGFRVAVFQMEHHLLTGRLLQHHLANERELIDGLGGGHVVRGPNNVVNGNHAIE